MPFFFSVPNSLKKCTVPPSRHFSVDFYSKEMDVGGETLLLQMWDTAGQERFQSLGRTFFRAADCVILCFDITRRPTFERVAAWDDIVRVDGDEADTGVTPAVRLLVGCKADREDERAVFYSDAAEIARERGWMFFETSAKSGAGVADAFACLATLAYHAHLGKSKEEKDGAAVDVRVHGDDELAVSSICQC